jgi:hypothetical protein
LRNGQKAIDNKQFAIHEATNIHLTIQQSNHSTNLQIKKSTIQQSNNSAIQQSNNPTNLQIENQKINKSTN